MRLLVSLLSGMCNIYTHHERFQNIGKVKAEEYVADFEKRKIN